MSSSTLTMTTPNATPHVCARSDISVRKEEHAWVWFCRNCPWTRFLGPRAERAAERPADDEEDEAV